MTQTTEQAQTKKALAGALQIVAAIAESIRELKTVPSGHLYAHLMGRISLDQYERIIDTLIRAGLVKKSYDELRWIGPEVQA